MSEKNQTSHAKKAAALSIVPGVGQFYNHQKIKGGLFLFFFAMYLFVFKDLFNMGIWGILTLGTECRAIILFFYWRKASLRSL